MEPAVRYPSAKGGAALEGSELVQRFRVIRV